MKNKARSLLSLKRPARILIAVLIGVVLTAGHYYLRLPPLNVFSVQFWTSLIAVILFFGVPLILLRAFEGQAPAGKSAGDGEAEEVKRKIGRGKFALKIREGNRKPLITLLCLVAAPVLVLILGGIVSSTFFNAHRYARLITVRESVFSEDMPETSTVTNISLMDTDSAIILGNRTLGALSDVVSQYRLSADYNQINYQGTPRKVSNLEYEDFFRWYNNFRNGLPGYVMVDPVNSKAEYIRLSKPLVYVDSAYFNQDLLRRLRLSYPTKIFDIAHSNFELDDEGNPYFIVSCFAPRIGLFGAMDVREVIIFDPCDGTSEIYPVGSCPAWVDNVYDGYLASRKFDWLGTLSGGFWNSIIGQKGCKKTTNDFGYLVLDDDVWYFTGVTSVIADESNIGFLLSNARTGEYKYYPVIGAEEYSAMGAAQGEVQEKGYVASFPSLINVSGQATYIMVLKDANGLVKLHALVNVENYSIVATGETQTEAKKAYVELLMHNGIIQGTSDQPGAAEAVFTVRKVSLPVVNGETIVYVAGDDGFVYKGSLALDETLILIAEGDRLSVSYNETRCAEIRSVVTWRRAPEG